MKRLLLLAGLLISLQQVTAQDGTLDPTFGNNGFVTLDTTYPSTAFQSGGQLLGVHPFANGFRLTRYDNNGNLDQSFGTGGTVTMNIPGIPKAFKALVAVFNNDDIIIALEGDSIPPVQNPILPKVRFLTLIKLKSNGALDGAFGDNGVAVDKEQLKAVYTIYETPPSLMRLNVTEEGRIFTTKSNTHQSRYSNEYTIKRFESKGSLDKDFAPYSFLYYLGNVVQLATGNEEIIAVGGGQSSQDAPRKGYLKINISTHPRRETIYSAYGFGGELTQEFLSAPEEGARAVAIQKDGKIIVASISGKMLRFNADLTLDNDFGDYIEQNKSVGYTTLSGIHYTYGEKGAVIVPFAVSKIIVQKDDKILVAGTRSTATAPVTREFVMYRYNPDGSLDATFGNNGVTYTNNPEGFGISEAIISNSRIYIYLKRSQPYTNDRIGAFRFNQSCTPPTFLNTLPIVGPATCGNNDGQISIIPTSGTAPFMYSLDGGATYISGPNVGYTKFNLAAGTYQLRLKDANGCESLVVTRTIITTGCPTCTPPTFLNTLPIVGDARCGANDGQISIIPTSGTGPFMYSINGGSTYITGPNVGYTFFNLAPGTYQLKLKAANGCESAAITRSIVVRYGVPAFLNTQPIVGDATCNKTDGQISIIPTSGTGPFMYSLNGGTTYVAGPNAGYTFFNLPAGMYQLRMKAGNGCESDVVTREVKMINCPPAAPTITGLSKSFIMEENGTDSKLKVSAYPNPSKGRFKVQVLQSAASKAEVFIYDSKGTLVQQARINPAKGSTIDLNLTGKAKGMYYLKVISNGGMISSKIIVQ